MKNSGIASKLFVFLFTLALVIVPWSQGSFAQDNEGDLLEEIDTLQRFLEAEKLRSEAQAEELKDMKLRLEAQKAETEAFELEFARLANLAKATALERDALEEERDFLHDRHEKLRGEIDVYREQVKMVELALLSPGDGWSKEEIEKLYEDFREIGRKGRKASAPEEKPEAPVKPEAPGAPTAVRPSPLTLVIPSAEFIRAPLGHTLFFLQLKAKDLDPKKPSGGYADYLPIRCQFPNKMLQEKEITLEVEDAQIKEILDEIVKQAGLQYRIEKDHLLVFDPEYKEPSFPYKFEN